MDQGSPRFQTTHWSVVLAAASGSSPHARASLEELCTRYWFPLYAHARRRGRSEDTARDDVQDFFASLLDRNAIQAATPERGRFRSFILRSFENHLHNQHARATAQKRGGGTTHLRLDENPALLKSVELGHNINPEFLFERDWTLTLLRRVLMELEDEYAQRGQHGLFVALREELGGRSVPHKELASTLGMTEGSVRVASHRLRARYGDKLRAAVADTLEDGADVEAELRGLLATLGGPP